MTLTPEGRIRTRLQTQQRLIHLKRKIHHVRKIVAGDYSAVEVGVSNTQPVPGERPKLDSLYDILVLDVKEGSSNLILQAMRTLWMQTAFSFPDINFADIAPEEATLNQLYLLARLGPKPRGCDATYHMGMALLDYMTGGMGWVWCGFGDGGVPAVKYVDTLDMSWDVDAPLLSDMRWVSCRVRQPRWEWIEQFPNATDSFANSASRGSSWEEELLECEYYYDLTGETGTAAVFRADGHAVGEKVEIGENPHFYDWDGARQPFLPIIHAHHFQLPSVKYPMGIAEMMIPSQLGFRASEEYINQTLQVGKPFYDIVKGSLDQENLDNLRENDFGSVIVREEQSAPITRQGGLDVPATVYDYQAQQKQALTAESGANPYAMGNKVEGVLYAAEVNAIQQASGLMAATIARDHSSHWSRMVAAVLANAVLYDDGNLRLNYKGTELSYGPDRPVRLRLRPDATPLISEDSLRYLPRQGRIAKAMQVLQVFSNPVMAQMFPAALPKAVENFLVESGEKHVQEWLMQPTAAGN